MCSSLHLRYPPCPPVLLAVTSEAGKLDAIKLLEFAQDAEDDGT